ncbi:MAG: carboxypeptidase regulatory-like domain-containing protein [Bacteroidota bacterium]
MRPFVFGLFLLASVASAQNAPVDLVLRGVPADEALATLAERTGVDVVYSSRLVGDAPVWCGGSGTTVEAVLGCITEAVGLDYVRRSSGTYVITEAVVEPASTGSVIGRVVDAETNAPLPEAHVLLADAGTATNRAGVFAVGRLQPGRYALAVSHVGYAPRRVWVDVAPGAAAQREVRLEPVVRSDGPVVVDALDAALPSETLGADAPFGTLDGTGPDRLGEGPPPLGREAPAATSDVTGGAVRSVLGVGGRTFRDGLSIQGGEAGDHPLLLGGATVYEPLSLGTALGALSPLAVGQVTVRKAGFGAEHGSFLAGVVQAEPALGAPRDGRPLSLATEADAFAASARLTGAAPHGAVGGEPLEAVAMAAVRRSLWDVVRPGALDAALRAWNDVDPVLASRVAGTDPSILAFDAHRHGSEVAFTDLHGAARVQVGPLRSVQASAYHGASDIATDLFASGVAADAQTPTALLLARDAYEWSNTAASVRADALASPRWRLHSQARLSRHSLLHRYDTVDGLGAGLDGDEPTEVAEARLRTTLDALPPTTDGNEVTEVAVGAGATVSLGPGHEAFVEVEGARASNRFHLLADGAGEDAFRDLDNAHVQWRAVATAASQHLVAGRWTVEPGLRLTTLGTGDVLAEPRLALRFDGLPGDRLGAVSARVAAGVYRQFTSRVDLATFGPSARVPEVAVWLPSDASVEPPRALHLAGEVLWRPAPGWAARVESYAKATPRLYALDCDALLSTEPTPLADQADFLLPGEGRAWGLGARVDRTSPRWAASLGAGIARTDRRFDDRLGRRWTPAPWAEPVRATADLRVLVAGAPEAGLTARARGVGVWGRSWAFRRAYYDVLPAHSGETTLGAFDLTRPEGDRLPALLTLDLGLAYAASVRGTRIEAALDVTNALDRANVLDWSLRPTATGDFEAVTRTLPGRQPTLRLRIGM